MGCVWGAVNFLPKEAVTLYRMIQSGDLAGGAELWQKVIDSQLFVWSHVYNAAVKAAANRRGFDVGTCRSPVLPLSGDESAELFTALDKLGSA